MKEAAKEYETLLKQVNDSGFPLQLAVEEWVRSHPAQQVWRIIGNEIAWIDPGSGNYGFCDLVLEHQFARLVIECKRKADGTKWVFLAAPGASPNVTRVRSYWVYRPLAEDPITSWSDWNFILGSPESGFCVTQGDSEGLMLESMASKLTLSAESLAREEANVTHDLADYARLYAPVIITTAALFVCALDPKAVSLTTGQLPSSHFEPVKMIRFRKSLATQLPGELIVGSLAEANEEKTRIVLVINAASFPSVLEDLELLPNQPEPWKTEYWARSLREQRQRRRERH